MTTKVIGLAALVVLASLSVAHAAELKVMPKEFVGNWCEERMLDDDVMLYRRTDHCELGKKIFVVHPTWFEDDQTLRCQVIKVGKIYDAARPVWSRCTQLIKGWKASYRSSFWLQEGELLAVHLYEPPNVEH
jgi:hypothetical protein